MPLKTVELDWQNQPMPQPRAAAFIADAEERIQRFITERAQSDPIPSFVASDFVMTDRALRAVISQRLAPGEMFCEWGSGFSVVAGLAALGGLSAYAIEIDRDLVDAGSQLLADHELDVEVAHGSLIPDGGEQTIDGLEGDHWPIAGGHTAYDEFGMDICDFDIIFAYPWPGEEEPIETLFDAFAAVGALLLTYHGMNEMKLQRKVG